MPTSREMRDAQTRYDNLQARADTASAGVQQFRTQQQAQGLVIRGDVMQALDRAKQFLSQTRTELSAGEVATANQYMNRAEAELTKVERFLGR